MDQAVGVTKIKPRKLIIVWGKDERYWRVLDKDDEPDEKCFAELSQVSWLEVTAEAPNLIAGKRYSIGFFISFDKDTMFGWDSPVFVMAKMGKAGKYKWKKVGIDTSMKGKEPFNIPLQGNELILDTSSSGNNTLYFGLYEVWSGRWKGGLRIHYAFVKEV